MDVEVADKSRFVELVKEQLSIDPGKTAIVAIDMNEGQLDPELAVQLVPEPARTNVLASTQKLIALARKYSIPVIHDTITRRAVESRRRRNPFARYARIANEMLPPEEQSWAGLHGRKVYADGAWAPKIMPEVAPGPDDYVIDNKKTYSAYYGTDLEILLRTLEVDTVVIVGINTNTCVQCSAFETVNLGFKLVVISDCVASAYGEDLHQMALQNIQRCFGWVLSLQEFEEKLAASESPAKQQRSGARAMAHAPDTAEQS